MTSTPPESLPRPVAAPGNALAPEVPVDGKASYQIIKPYFKKYLRRSLDGKVNVFKSNLAQFAPTVDIESPTETSMDEPRTPLEFYDANSYRLVLIMSGTAQAKALLVDPRDKAYVIQVGTKVGNRNGKVSSITATEVRIDEPGYPPVLKALESPIEDMERELQAVQEY
jgi:hypothetical protein